MQEAHAFENMLREQELMTNVKSILAESASNYDFLLQEEADRIFSLPTIEKICVDYRLRFLKADLFKGTIPEEAYYEVEKLEAKYNTRFRSFRIIAPAEYFDLSYIDKDPIMLAELEPNKYMFIHKWGGEFNSWRKIKSYPFRTVRTALISIVFMAAVLSLFIAAISTGITQIRAIDFLFAVFHFTVGGTLFMTFIALAFSVYPSQMMWKSKHLDF